MSGGFLERLLEPLLKAVLSLIENVVKPLAKSVLVPLSFTAAPSATDSVIQKTIYGWGHNNNSIFK